MPGMQAGPQSCIFTNLKYHPDCIPSLGPTCPAASSILSCRKHFRPLTDSWRSRCKIEEKIIAKIFCSSSPVVLVMRILAPELDARIKFCRDFLQITRHSLFVFHHLFVEGHWSEQKNIFNYPTNSSFLATNKFIWLCLSTNCKWSRCLLMVGVWDCRYWWWMIWQWWSSRVCIHQGCVKFLPAWVCLDICGLFIFNVTRITMQFT